MKQFIATAASGLMNGIPALANRLIPTHVKSLMSVPDRLARVRAKRGVSRHAW
ncbi:hypothetical protein ACWC0C_42450 [Streptomyces sp. NPDC001709]